MSDDVPLQPSDSDGPPLEVGLSTAEHGGEPGINTESFAERVRWYMNEHGLTLEAATERTTEDSLEVMEALTEPEE